MIPEVERGRWRGGREGGGEGGEVSGHYARVGGPTMVVITSDYCNRLGVPPR